VWALRTTMGAHAHVTHAAFLLLVLLSLLQTSARVARPSGPTAYAPPPPPALNATTDDACASVLCGRHGECQVRGGFPECVCEVGFATVPSSSSVCTNGDLAALLAFKATGDPRGVLASWREPCPGCPLPCNETGWNRDAAGFVGVMCSRPFGRITYVFPALVVRPWSCGLRTSIAPLAGLPHLETLALDGCTAVHGNVGALGGLTQLRYLNLRATAVHGVVDSLAGLSHLGEHIGARIGCSERNDMLLCAATHLLWLCCAAGEFYRAPDGSGGTGLYLADSHVHGRVAGLRALPGLGPSWGSAQQHFSSCEEWSAEGRGSGGGSSAEAEGLFNCVDTHPPTLGCKLIAAQRSTSRLAYPAAHRPGSAELPVSCWLLRVHVCVRMRLRLRLGLGLRFSACGWSTAPHDHIGMMFSP
jgi:hypothetical protein